MDHVAQHLANLPSNRLGTPPAATSERLLERHRRVWSALAEMFGQTLLTNFGPTPPPLWCKRVDELEDWEIKRGLERLSKSDSSFAPTIGQFWTACKTNDGQRAAPDTDAPMKLIQTTPGKHGLPGGMSPICYQLATDTAAGKWPFIGGAHQSPAALSPAHWRVYQAATYRNAEAHQAYCAANPAQVQAWERERAAKWGNVEAGA